MPLLTLCTPLEGEDPHARKAGGVALSRPVTCDRCCNRAWSQQPLYRISWRRERQLFVYNFSV